MTAGGNHPDTRHTRFPCCTPPRPPTKQLMNILSAFVRRVSCEVRSREAVGITELVAFVSVSGGVFPEDKHTPSPYPGNPSSSVVPEVELFSTAPRPSFYKQPCMKDQPFVKQPDN